MLSDIEIAQNAKMKHIRDVAASIGIAEDDLEFYGKYKAKIASELLGKVKDNENGKLILVTAINPTPAGEGKTTTTIGLGDVLATTLVGRVLSIFLSICSILIIAVVPGVITSYYVESTKLRADESSAKFLDDLERLPELSKEEPVELSEKVKKFNRKK